MLEKFVRLTLRFPKIVLGIGLILTLVSIHLTGKIRIRSNFSDLLPDDHPVIQQTRELEKVVGGASSIVVAVETKNPQAADSFLTDLRKKIEGLQGIRYIDDRPPTAFLKREALLYLSDKDLDDLYDRIRRKIEEGKLRRAGLYISFDEEGGFSGELDRIQEKYGSFLAPNPRHQNPAGTLFVSLIKPDWRTTEVARTEVFVEKLNRILRDLDPKKYDPSMSAVLTGPYVKTLSQKKILLQDAALVSVLSFLGSIAYLLFHFRRKRALFLIGLPLMASVSWSLGVAWFLFGSLNLFSSAITAILLGLAADYGIHIYSEYLRHRRDGENPEQSLVLAVTHLGRSFLTASSTTAAAFLALTLTRFKALHEFGAIAGCGVILCAGAFVLLFPPLTLLIERRRPQKIAPIEWSERRQKFSRSWIQFSFSQKNLILSGIFLLLPIATVAAGRPRFDYNMNHILGKQGTKELDRRVDAIFNHTVNPEVALAQNLEDAGRLSSALRRLRDKNEKTGGGTTIKAAFSLKDFVPDRQAEKIAKIRKVGSLFTDRIIGALGEKDRKFYEDLKGLLDPKAITLGALPREITEKFEDREGKSGRMVVIFPNFDISRADRFMRFVEEIREVRCPDCSGPFYASGESTVFYEIVKMLFREGRTVIGVALVSILAALFINFRSWGKTLMVFSPLVIGILATVGWMGLTGIPFNIINLAALPIILGTADDYAIHLFQRYLDHPDQSLEEAYRFSFRPIVGSSATTLIGFGSLLVADMGGIRSFGLLSAVGIFLCTLTTLIWFPAFLSFSGRHRKKAALLLFVLFFAFQGRPAEASGPFTEDFEQLEAGKFPNGFISYPAQRSEGPKVYTVQADSDNRYLRATAAEDRSVQIFRPFSWDTGRWPLFSWRWRAKTLPQGGAEDNVLTNDSACGIYIVFGRSSTKTIKYVWSSSLPRGTILEKDPNKFFTEVMETGRGKVGTWQRETVNVVQDYRRFFQANPTKEPPGFGILTDGNATHTISACDYDDFTISNPVPGGGTVEK